MLVDSIDFSLVQQHNQFLKLKRTTMQKKAIISVISIFVSVANSPRNLDRVFLVEPNCFLGGIDSVDRLIHLSFMGETFIRPCLTIIAK